MITSIWDGEAKRYLGLSPEERRRWLAQLVHAITMFTRGTYVAGGLGVEDPEKLRRCNEFAHRIADHLRGYTIEHPGMSETYNSQTGYWMPPGS